MTTYYKMRARDSVCVPQPTYVTWVVPTTPDLTGANFIAGGGVFVCGANPLTDLADITIDAVWEDGAGGGGGVTPLRILYTTPGDTLFEKAAHVAAGYTRWEAECVGAGGGGGGGRKGAVGTDRFGGNGGGGGGRSRGSGFLADLPASFNISVSPGGAGGVGASANDTDGATGNITYPPYTAFFYGSSFMVVAWYGRQGAGGKAVAGVEQAVGGGGQQTGTPGAVASTFEGATGNKVAWSYLSVETAPGTPIGTFQDGDPPGLLNGSHAAGGGGAGGGINAAESIEGAGSPGSNADTAFAFPGGGAAGGAAPGGAGGSAATFSVNPNLPWGGAGGGGGAARIAGGDGGAGGAGSIYGGGGGGGGAGTNAAGNGGNGGNGANGIVVLVLT